MYVVGGWRRLVNVNILSRVQGGRVHLGILGLRIDADYVDCRSRCAASALVSLSEMEAGQSGLP